MCGIYMVIQGKEPVADRCFCYICGMDLQTRTLSIFGKEYRVYSGACCSTVSNRRTLYVEFTNICNAHCPFCSSSRGAGVLSPDILKACLDELVAAGAIDRVSITGGEPLIVGDHITLSRLFSELDESGVDYYALTTNGRYLAKNFVMLDTLSKLKYLNVSRHHYDDEANRHIFGDRKIPGLDEITGIFGLFGDKPLEFRLNCTLYPGADAYFVNRYIQAAADAGISSILFRSDYFSTPDPVLAGMFRDLLGGRKESTKCRCVYGNVSGVKVEYREVGGALEQRLETEGGYIRNFVLHADGRLTGGWSDESVLIRDFPGRIGP